MKIWKQRLAVLLSLALVFTMALPVIPQTETTVQAASRTTEFWWDAHTEGAGANAKSSFQVEKGQTFLLGGLCVIYNEKEDVYGRACNVTGVTYKTSNSKIASITKKGQVTTKKTGTVKLTVKYGKASSSVTVTVVGTGKLGSTSKTVKNYNKTLRKYAKSMQNVTKSARYSAVNNYVKLNTYIDKIHKTYKYTNTGFSAIKNSYTSSYNGETFYYTSSNHDKLVVTGLTDAKAYGAMCNAMVKTSPIGTTASKYFKIKSVSAKSNSTSFSITLKSKVTEDQFFGAQATDVYYLWKTKTIKNGKAGTFDMHVYDATAKQTYTAVVTMTKNSKTLKVKMPTNVKLVKGHTYNLRGIADWTGKYGWAKNKSFKAK